MEGNAWLLPGSSKAAGAATYQTTAVFTVTRAPEAGSPSEALELAAPPPPSQLVARLSVRGQTHPSAIRPEAMALVIGWERAAEERRAEQEAAQIWAEAHQVQAGENKWAVNSICGTKTHTAEHAAAPVRGAAGAEPRTSVPPVGVRRPYILAVARETAGSAAGLKIFI